MSTVLPLACPEGPRRARAAFLAAALLCGVSCGPASNLPSDADWPSGALLSADRAQLLRMLSEAEQLEGTPLARLARELRRMLPDCDALEARVSGPPATFAGASAVPSGFFVGAVLSFVELFGGARFANWVVRAVSSLVDAIFCIVRNYNLVSSHIIYFLEFF